jgi:NTP pyrophosphatase (non-canonical NTP hydrolase)
VNIALKRLIEESYGALAWLRGTVQLSDRARAYKAKKLAAAIAAAENHPVADVTILHGPKPVHCPAPFEHCGDCNIYPCRIDSPAPSVDGVCIQRDLEMTLLLRVSEGTFVMPSLEHALMFLTTEVGETIDALLRGTGIPYVYSNDRQHNLADELADVAAMAYVCATLLGVDLDEQIRIKWRLHETDH